MIARCLANALRRYQASFLGIFLADFLETLNMYHFVDKYLATTRMSPPDCSTNLVVAAQNTIVVVPPNTHRFLTA
jgi:hypothetical protein